MVNVCGDLLAVVEYAQIHQVELIAEHLLLHIQSDTIDDAFDSGRQHDCSRRLKIAKDSSGSDYIVKSCRFVRRGGSEGEVAWSTEVRLAGMCSLRFQSTPMM